MHIAHMEKLASYLERHGLTQRQFADSIGKDQSVVCRLANGLAAPGLDTAIRIQTATAGEVPITAWPTIAAVVAAARGPV